MAPQRKSGRTDAGVNMEGNNSIGANSSIASSSASNSPRSPRNHNDMKKKWSKWTHPVFLGKCLLISGPLLIALGLGVSYGIDKMLPDQIRKLAVVSKNDPFSCSCFVLGGAYVCVSCISCWLGV